MTREEAIKIIRREYSCVDRDCDIERSCGKCPYSMPSKEPILKAYCLAVEALELVTSYEGTINKLTEALNQQRWIPVDERLPEKEGLYLVTVKRRLDYSFATNNYEYEFVVAIRRYTKGHGYSWGMRKSQVIAWMPLPKPYKKEGE